MAALARASAAPPLDAAATSGTTAAQRRPVFCAARSTLLGGLLVAPLGATGCNASFVERSLGAAPGAARGAVEIHAPARLTSLSTAAAPGTQPLRVACVTCHSLRPTDAGLPTSTADLTRFHVGLTFRHGDTSCAGCHVAGRPDLLHLADGAQLPTRDALRLCAQCHGPQWRDYRHGAHGGMTGSWDLSRGGRARNHCVDCHDPHAPAFVGGAPAPPPRDRQRTETHP